MKLSTMLMAAGIATTVLAQSAAASTVQFSDSSGLSATATFALLNGGSTLQIALRNTSTGAPASFAGDPANYILSGIAFNMGGVNIVHSGSGAHLGASSQSVNFNSYQGPGSDTSGEFGFGNGGNTGFGSLVNFVSSSQGGNPTRFSGANLHGPPPGVLNGPAGGLISQALLGSLGGKAAINDEVIFTLNLDGVLSDLSFLSNGAKIEFGSDAFFLDGTMTTVVIPLPGAAGMAGVGLVLIGSRRRR